MKVLQILVSTNMDKVGRLQKANKLSSPLLSYKEIIQKRLLASWKISYLQYTFKYFSISFTRFKIYIWVKFKPKSLVKFPKRTITKWKNFHICQKLHPLPPIQYKILKSALKRYWNYSYSTFVLIYNQHTNLFSHICPVDWKARIFSLILVLEPWNFAWNPPPPLCGKW